MGVGLPFAVGAKAAKPEAQIICLRGDGSFGQNAMELDTAVRHKLPLLCVISLNGGWTADPERNKPAATSAIRATTRWPRRSAATPNMSKTPKTSARPCSALGAGSRRAWSALSTSRPTTAPGHDRALFEPRDLTSQLPVA